MGNNCTDCKFKKSAFSRLGGVTEEMTHLWDGFYVQCLTGNTNEIVEFYTKNKDVRSNEITDTLSCFTKTQFAESADKLISLMDAFIEKQKLSSKESQ